jgi:hypothetical protein
MLFAIEAKKVHVFKHHLGYVAMDPDNELRYVVGVSQLPIDNADHHCVVMKPLTPGDVLRVLKHPYTGEIVLQRIEP